jgi:hypothetical protein
MNLGAARPLANSRRVAAISDMHGRLPGPEDFPECDIALIAGDSCPIEDHSPLGQYRWLEGVFAPWLTQLSARASHVIGIAGNHDLIFARQPTSVASLPWTYLQDEAAELCGLTVYASPWVPFAGGGWAFQGPENDGEEFLGEKFEAVPSELDILLTHTPAYSMRDTTLDGAHEGSRALLEAIHHQQPRLHVAGHIHEGRGVGGFGTHRRWTVSANVSFLNWDYQPTNRGPMVFDIPRERTEPVRVVSR